MQKKNSFKFIAIMFAWLALSPFAYANEVHNSDVSVQPRFEDFPSNPTNSDNRFTSHVTMSTAQAKRYRTVISLEGLKEPNFAGHFRIVTWGCGTDCHGFAIVDRKTGIARTVKGIDYVAGAMGNDQPRIDFRKDSRLLILNGLINDSDEGTFAYEWTGKRLKPLLRLPLAKEVFSDSPAERQ